MNELAVIEIPFNSFLAFGLSFKIVFRGFERFLIHEIVSSEINDAFRGRGIPRNGLNIATSQSDWSTDQQET